MALNALFTGSAALQANSSALDVIGNNLANSNTTGFKAQRVQFRDLVYQTLSNGSGPSGGTGAINPAQLGFGVGVGAVDSNLGQGNLNSTGRTLDLGIQGSGYFILRDGNQTVYSRAGAFDVDAAGFLTDPNSGFRVQRFGSVGETAPAFQTPGDLNIRVPLGSGVQGTPTSRIDFQGNLSSTTAIGDSYSTAIQIFDSQSTSRSMNLTFTKTAANTFQLSADVSGATGVTLSTNSLVFDGNGLLVTPASPSQITATVNGLAGAQSIILDLGEAGQSIGITQFGNASTAAAATQDGRGAGTLNSVTVDASGVIQGIYSNGRTIALAQIALANFNNPNGLLRQGNNYFGVSASSGEPLIGPAGTGARGTIQGGSLEGSNVDIAIEFSRLIIAQRGFQVNARTITASNEVLQELANIIR